VAAVVGGYMVNASLVALGASLLYGEPVAKVSRELRIGHPLEFLVSYLALGAAGVLAPLYLQVGFWAVLSLVGPLIVIRQLFFRSLALDQARATLAAAYEAERMRVRDPEELDRKRATTRRRSSPSSAYIRRPKPSSWRRDQGIIELSDQAQR